MTLGGRREIRPSGMAIMALVIPALAGLLYLVLFDAPVSYIAINAGALLVSLVWVVFGRLPEPAGGRLLLASGLTMLLAIPLMTGPAIDGITRWISLGGFSLHVGMLVIPLIAVLSASLRKAGAMLLLIATLIAFAQPDMASTLALALASIGIWLTAREWTFGAVGALGLFAALGASFSGGLPPQPFVEHVLSDLWPTDPIMAVVIVAALLSSLLIILISVPAQRGTRFALTGALAGFVCAAMIGSYPHPVVGYGAAAILGMGLALGGSTAGKGRGF